MARFLAFRQALSQLGLAGPGDEAKVAETADSSFERPGTPQGLDFDVCCVVGKCSTDPEVSTAAYFTHNLAGSDQAPIPFGDYQVVDHGPRLAGGAGEVAVGRPYEF